MKKLILTTVFLGSLMVSMAQISLGPADMPRAGMINYVYVDTTSTPSLGSPSATPQNWNFSTLYSHYPQVASFSPVTPYQAYAPSFPGTNMFTYGPSILYAGLYGGAPVDIDNWGYMFWRSDTTGFHIVGFRANYGIGERNILETPQELLMGVPASYDSSFANSSRWVASFNNQPLDADTHYISTVYKTLECDAFGSMTTPFGVFNVIRVHEFMVTVDSITATLGSITYYGWETLRDTVNNYHFWANGLGYPVAIAKCDADNNIQRIEYLFDTINGITITGSVFKSNGTTPVNTGEAELFAATLIDELYGVPEIVPLVAGGHFQFSNTVPGGTFLVHARPDTTVYPYDVPTYYGDSIYWQDAATLTVLADTAITINCQSDSLAYLMSGMGSITGTIYQNLGGAKDMVVAGGIKVTLEQNPSGSTARHTYTDVNGKYQFKDIPADDFTIRVDLPACPMDSTYYIYYSMGDTTTANLDFYYDSTFIYIFNTSGIQEAGDIPSAQLMVYPNPFTEESWLYFTEVQPGMDCELDIYDPTGRLIDRIPGTTPYPIRIQAPEHYQGLLFYSLIINGVRTNSGKLLVK